MKFYKTIITIIAVLIFLFLACGEERVDDVTIGENSEPTSTDNLIVITSEQLSFSGMELGKITQKSFSERILTTGTLDVPPEYKAAVSVYYGGTVKNLHLLVGEKIKMGQTLFTLENPEFIQMQQDYLNAKNSLKYLQKDYERQRKLSSENVSSQKKYLKAETDYFTVRSNFEALGQKLQLLNINPSDLNFNSITSSAKIKAPISGNITEVNISKGEYLSPTKVAVGIVNTEHMHLELNVFEKDIFKIKKGETIKFTQPDNRTTVYEAEVFLVGKSVNTVDRTINIHGHLKNETQESNFIPGMYIEAEILVGEVTHPAINEDAVVNVEDEYFVLIKKSSDQETSTFIQREVMIGKTIYGFTQILNADEFSKNDEFVIKGAFNLVN